MNNKTFDHKSRPFPIVITGHVDHGKSTLVGRLLFDTGSLSEAKVEEVKHVSKRRGQNFEWAFLLDALQVERDQGITLDTTRVWFKSKIRPYMLIDAPGHKTFLKNMVSGSSDAEGGVLVIDAVEGVSEQSMRHASLLSLLGIRQIVVAINKMDLIKDQALTFDELKTEMSDYLNKLGMTHILTVPVSAKTGANLIGPAEEFNWYNGISFVDALDELQHRPSKSDQVLRFPVQDVYKVDDKRLIVGRVESGQMTLGDTLTFYPGGATGKITHLDNASDEEKISTVSAGQSVAVELNDDLFIERGLVAVNTQQTDQAGFVETDMISVRLFWLDERHLMNGDELTLGVATKNYRVRVVAIERVVDIESLDVVDPTGGLEHGRVAIVHLKSRSMMALDINTHGSVISRGVLKQKGRTVGGCVIEIDLGNHAKNITYQNHQLVPADRSRLNGHDGGVLWFTGLSGSGKTTLAMGLEKKLFDRGWQVFTLDGDNLRHGLSADLGFAPEDRRENIRRAAEAAKLLSEVGVVVLATFISPMVNDREMARTIIGDGFHEVHVSADLKTCEARDPKGLYVKARNGDIPEFTGVSAPYEAPIDPQFVAATGDKDIEKTINEALEYALRSFSDRAKKLKRVS